MSTPAPNPRKEAALAAMRAHLRAMGIEPTDRPLPDLVAEAEAQALARVEVTDLMAVAESMGWVVTIPAPRVLSLASGARVTWVRVGRGEAEEEVGKREIAETLAGPDRSVLAVAHSAQRHRRARHAAPGES